MFFKVSFFGWFFQGTFERALLHTPKRLFVDPGHYVMECRNDEIRVGFMFCGMDKKNKINEIIKIIEYSSRFLAAAWPPPS